MEFIKDLLTGAFYVGFIYIVILLYCYIVFLSGPTYGLFIVIASVILPICWVIGRQVRFQKKLKERKEE